MKPDLLALASVIALVPSALAWRSRHVRPLRAPAQQARGRGACYASLDGVSGAELQLAHSLLVGLSLQLPDSVSGTLGELGNSLQGALENVPSIDGAQDSVKGLLEGIPSPDAAIPDSVKQQLDSLTEALPQATEKLQGLLSQFNSAVSSVQETLNSNKIAADVQGQANALKEQFSGQLNQQLGQVSGQLGQQLGELGRKLGDATSEALTPYQPIIKDFTDASGKVLTTVTEEQRVVLENLSPALRVARSFGTPRNIFNYENLISAAVWASVILAPDNPAVKQVMRSYLVVVGAALAYTWLAYLCFQDPVALQGFSSMTDLGGLTKGFASQTAVATVWAHLIAGDLFVGRWIYLDGLKNSVWTRHSLLLCFFFGPVGFLSHLFTRGLVKVVRWDISDIMESGLNRVPPSAAEGQAAATVKEAEKALKKAERKAEELLAKAEREREKAFRAAQREAEAIVNEAVEERDKLIAKGRAEGRRLLESAQAKASAAPAAAAVPTVDLPPREAPAPAPAPKPAMSAETAAPQQ